MTGTTATVAGDDDDGGDEAEGERSPWARLRDRVRSVSPLSLAMLGLLGVVGDLVPPLELLELFHAFWLFAFWPFASMLADAARAAVGFADGPDEDEGDPRDWLDVGDGWRGHAAFLLGLPLSFLNPLVFRQDAMQLLGSVFAAGRHRGSLPDPESHEQSVSYRLPVEGTWTVVNGSPREAYSHSWFPATQRYAYDLVVTDGDGRSRPAGADASVENYYCYDRPVLAPAEGTVVDVRDGDPELGRAAGLSHPLKRSVTGNAVTLRHADGEYSSLLHLVPGSVPVEAGDAVERGERIGRCGHSGNSAEPHLHVQFQDHPAFELAAGLPVRFDDVDVETPGVDVAESAGWTEPDGPGEYVHVGQRVTHAAAADDDDATRPPADGDAAPPPSPTAAPATPPALGLVRALSGVAAGFSVGGFLTVLAGAVTPSLSAIAAVVAAAAGVGLAFHVGRRLLAGDRDRAGSRWLVAGVAAAAGVVGAVAAPGTPVVRPSALGTGVFLAGFLAYAAAWEGGRPE